MARGPPASAPAGAAGWLETGHRTVGDGTGSVWLHGAVLVPPRGEQGPSATAGQSERCHSRWKDDTAGQADTDTPGNGGTQPDSRNSETARQFSDTAGQSVR